MPFINKSEATKRSKDRQIYGKCTNGTNSRSRVWPVCFINSVASQLSFFRSLVLFFFSFARTQLLRAWNRRSIKQPPLLVGNWSKVLHSKRIHLWEGGGGWGSITYLRTLPTTFYWLLNLSSYGNIQPARVGITRQTRKVRFESHCNFLLLDRGVVMQ